MGWARLLTSSCTHCCCVLGTGDKGTCQSQRKPKQVLTGPVGGEARSWLGFLFLEAGEPRWLQEATEGLGQQWTDAG